MKNCPYCGKEYPDGATVCGIDGETLVASAGAAAARYPTAEMTWLDKKFAKVSDPLLGGISGKIILPLAIIGIYACKHPVARKNAWSMFGWQMGLLALALIILVLLKSLGWK